MCRLRASWIFVAALLLAALIAVTIDRRDLSHAPVRGVMGFGFGRPIDYQSCGFHTGQDWFAAEGAKIFAVEAGEVVHVGPMWMSGDGVGRGEQAIIIDHGGWYSTYGHNRAAEVEAGVFVTRGQIIGEVGSDGFSRGPHLHFEKVVTPFTGDWQQPFAGCDGYVDPGLSWSWF